MKSEFSSNTGSTGAFPAQTNFSVSLMALLFGVLGSIYLFIVHILGKIGLDENGTVVMVVLIPIAVYLLASVIIRISSPHGLAGLGQFQKAENAFGVVQTGMAGSSEWISLLLIIGLIAQLSNFNHDGLALMAGIYAGLVLAAVVVVPNIKWAEFISIPRVVSDRVNGSARAKHILRLSIAFVIVLCAMFFVVAQIGAGAQIIRFHFPIPTYWAAILLVIPVMIALLSGGMRGLTFTNILLFILIAAALILPAIWLSQRITGNPLPQFSFGTGALQPILELENQLKENIGDPSRTNFSHGNFSNLENLTEFLFTFFMMIAGSATLPLLFSRIAGKKDNASRSRSIGWLLVLLAFVLSFIPAFIIFMKFEIYRDLVGLPISQLNQSANWLFTWASFEGGHHALICGKSAIDIDAITVACGEGPEYVLLPSDLKFSPLMTFLGAGHIANMPPVFSALAYTGLLSAAATTLAIALMVVANTARNDLIAASSAGKKPNAILPIGRELALLRASLIIACALGIWASLKLPVPVTDFALWGFSVSAGAIFPVLLLSLVWRQTTVFGALAGVFGGLFVTLYLLIAIEYGPDWIAQNGDEPVWHFPLSMYRLRTTDSAIVGMLVATISVLAISAIENQITQYYARSAAR